MPFYTNYRLNLSGKSYPKGENTMKYVFTKAEKRKQQNIIIQLWRFAVLGLKFNKLMNLECRYPPEHQHTLDKKDTASPSKQQPRASHS